MIQLNAAVCREGPSAREDRELQDLPHLIHAAEGLGEGGGHLLEGQDLGQIQSTHIGEQQEHACAHRAPEEQQASGGNHQHHTALHQQQKGGVGRSGLAGHQIPDAVFLLNGVGELLKRPAAHVVRLAFGHRPV